VGHLPQRRQRPGLDWATCRALLDDQLPGAVAQAIKDADTMFRIELPVLTE
jgi:hypothetical protein